MEQLRVDKDAEIEKLASARDTARGEADRSADALLADLWDRLASVKPPLAPGGQQPNVQAVERLVDAFVEFAKFVQEFDQSMRPFLTRYTRDEAPNVPSVRRPWEVYAGRDDLWEVIAQTIAAKGGKHVGALRMKLRLCREWALAALVGSDATVEFIGSELQAHLQTDECAMRSDPNIRVRDYLRQSGPDIFQARMRQLRSRKVAESYTGGR